MNTSVNPEYSAHFEGQSGTSTPESDLSVTSPWDNGWWGKAMYFDGENPQGAYNYSIASAQTAVRLGATGAGLLGGPQFWFLGDIAEAGLHLVSGGIGILRTDSTLAAQAGRAATEASLAIANPLPGGSLLNKGLWFGGKTAVSMATETAYEYSNNHDNLNGEVSSTEVTAQTSENESVKTAETTSTLASLKSSLSSFAWIPGIAFPGIGIGASLAKRATSLLGFGSQQQEVDPLAEAAAGLTGAVAQDAQNIDAPATTADQGRSQNASRSLN